MKLSQQPFSQGEHIGLPQDVLKPPGLDRIEPMALIAGEMQVAKNHGGPVWYGMVTWVRAVSSMQQGAHRQRLGAVEHPGDGAQAWAALPDGTGLEDGGKGVDSRRGKVPPRGFGHGEVP